MKDRFNIRYFNKNTKEFEYHKIGAINTKPYTDCTIYEEGQFCTGLKDKAEKLIYEGDIVEVINCRGANAVVEYNIDLAMFKLKGEKFSPSALQHIRKDYFEVIGNIYTDAHLLEETKND